MSVTSGSPTQAPTAVGTSAELTGIVDTDLTSGDMASTSSGGLAMWLLDKASTATLGTGVVATKSGAGRWIQQPNAPVAGGNFTYSVADTTVMPSVLSVPDGTWVYVQSQRSWYWTDRQSNTYRRLIVPNEAWMAQTAYEINTTTGNDNNPGTALLPLLTAKELIYRLAGLNRDTTVTVQAGSAFGANDLLLMQPVGIPGAQATAPILTINGTRTLGADNLVAASSDEAGNNPPLIDIGIALVPGTLIQATSGAQSGATAPVLQNVGGTVYRTAPWRNAAGTRVVPPAPGDNVATISNPTVARVGFGGTISIFRMTNMTIATLDMEIGRSSVIFRTSQIAGSIIAVGMLGYLIDGCGLNMVGGWQFRGVNAFTFFKCAILGSTSTALIEAGASLIMNDCVYNQTPTIIVQNNAFLDINSLGIFGTVGSALTVVRGAQVRIRGTLYGTGNAGDGTRVLANGHVIVDAAFTPTLAAAGQELQLEGQVTANPPPPLATGVIPVAAALTTWAQWVGAPFARQVMSYFSGSSITSA